MRKPWRNLWLKSGRLILDRDSFFKCEGNYERARGVILRYLHIITIVVEELLINLTRNLKDEIVTFRVGASMIKCVGLCTVWVTVPCCER